MNQIECEKCQTVPEKFVCLDCEHSFCLSCLAKLFKQHESQIECATCFEITLLDDETINALMEAKLQLIQPPFIMPYTTSKKQNNQKDQMQIKGHPFIERLNVSIEKCLDNIRVIQFDRQKIREISNKIKQDLESEFKSLHLYLDDKQEAFMNEISRFETLNSTNLQKQEDGFQIDIKEMQIMKDEIKSILQQQTGIQNDIEQFKIILKQIDEITIKTNQQYQSHLKQFQDEIYKLPLQWTDFSSAYKQFFSSFDTGILQSIISQKQKIDDVESELTKESSRLFKQAQFITVNRLEKIHQSLASQISNTNVKPIKASHKSHISLCSPPRNSFLQDEYQIPRKSSRVELSSKLQSTAETRVNSMNRKNTRTMIPNLNLGGISFIK
ncbi:unnamed protein product (macronuclear) [Paramecium tetraurelia]|uniref:RING-type domain-containing protein n=1 Tax=Paramecium tetraurelia TaxID=5888 RepID=A0DJT8_PARTE|nr:uncharacterized protein GSPATT00017649001 [Paramecium tetraurelia]CAK83305.1 unnamed protein product [Paramecium tetraurelia]|eukprot:XP_001450702.1 hypothetical protein (macronuclear) [Paramecium tetraurelia strain d4-2]